MYYKKVDYTSNKAMFDFLVNHFEYDTMNSWNGLRSIANNVKLYNIEGIDVSEALEALEDDDYFTINQEIKEWEEDHPGYGVGFNGRSGGYLVLYKSGSNLHALTADDNNSPCNYYPKDYDNWKRDVQADWGSLKEYQPQLIAQVKLIQEFDKLCDDLVETTKYLIQEMKDRKTRTKKYGATLRFQRYYYDTLEDLKLHMLDMKRRGYSVWEWSDEDLYVEYEMNESISSEIILEREGDEDFVC